jgi:hypothetical protein
MSRSESSTATNLPGLVAALDSDDSTYLSLRSVGVLVRQPVFLVITLVQPMVWLLLFGTLFESVVRIPGFAGGTSYLSFLTPGVIAMTALFSAMWAGTVYVDDRQRGVMDRLLASPVRRAAMINGTLAHQSLTSLVQTVIVLVVAVVAGARFTMVCAALWNAIRPDGAPAGGADRDQPAAEPADDVPVLGDHGPAADARVDADGGALQPARLGRGRQPADAARQPGLGGRLAALWLRSPCWPC